MTGRLRWAGLLLVVGLVIEALSLLWSHPLAFVAFIAPGGVLITAGVLLYLWALLTRSPVGPTS